MPLDLQRAYCQVTGEGRTPRGQRETRATGRAEAAPPRLKGAPVVVARVRPNRRGQPNAIKLSAR